MLVRFGADGTLEEDVDGWRAAARRPEDREGEHSNELATIKNNWIRILAPFTLSS